MDKNKTLTEAANDLIEHAMERGIPGRMIPFVEALRVAKNERKAESDAARLEIDSLKAKNIELERVCDATYVTQGADAYNHACSMMEQYQAEREAARKEVGAEGSLCDGISWLYTRIASLESQLEAVGTGGDVQPYDQQAMGLCHVCGWKGVIDYPDSPVCVACEHDKTLPPQPTAQDALAYQEACSLATHVFKKHFSKDVEYASGKVTWGLCDTTAGVISQLDNMVCRLVEPAAQAQNDAKDAALWRALQSIPKVDKLLWQYVLSDEMRDGHDSVEQALVAITSQQGEAV